MLYIFYKIYDIEKFDDKGTGILPPFLIRNLDQGKRKPQVHFPCATPGALTLTPSITHHAPYSPAPSLTDIQNLLPLRCSKVEQLGSSKQELFKNHSGFYSFLLPFLTFELSS